jgi:3'-phosphoadenosine 5'-phosphosulfate (PAPS) 3'-phosphatase
MLSDNDNDIIVLELAVALAKQAGVVIADAVNRPRTFATKSSIIDCVTETDEQCEKIIIANIRSLFPTHKFIAEESYKGDGEYDISDHPTWLIDPIDGTNNFVHGLHYVCGITCNTSLLAYLSPVHSMCYTMNDYCNNSINCIYDQGCHSYWCGTCTIIK